MLLESTLRASLMAWQKWRSNLALTANSIRRRWRNSSFSIIPAGAFGSAWRWIGKRQICLLENRGRPKTSRRLNENNASDPQYRKLLRRFLRGGQRIRRTKKRAEAEKRFFLFVS